MGLSFVSPFAEPAVSLTNVLGVNSARQYDMRSF
jgi:hypothetical protein